uniref:Pre-mRNA-splicing factor SLU7 n=1 Tax=Timema cristinae TaxID=61476 RepID=A0A7R9GT48_TIMCR|nr:unnamed protein product [Timema cristinae]
MAATQNVPVSEILRNKTQLEDDEPKKKSREDWRKAKELEEARKAGTAPAAVDEEGKDINPHIPQYISAAPWYFGSKGPTLKHQRPQPEKQREYSQLDEWYRRGVDTSTVAIKFRKGACENCGALTHNKKDCMERPRKVGARFTDRRIISQFRPWDCVLGRGGRGTCAPVFKFNRAEDSEPCLKSTQQHCLLDIQQRSMYGNDQQNPASNRTTNLYRVRTIIVSSNGTLISWLSDGSLLVVSFLLSSILAFHFSSSQDDEVLKSYLMLEGGTHLTPTAFVFLTKDSISLSHFCHGIAPDEFIQRDLSMDYDGKRDRWAGYDPSEHKAIIEEYQKVEEAKRQLRAEKLNANIEGEEEEEAEELDKEDEDKYVDEVDMPGTKVDSKQRITVRNLRIREDTAKYLRNLDPNSAYYDPKTRSMRDNPYVGVSEQDVDYGGENFVRFSGDTQKHSVAQLFAWEAYEKGVDVHLLAEPTKLEMLQHEYDKKKDQFKSQVQGNILDKYGGAEHLQAPPKSLLLAQTEDYVEYSRYGKIVKWKPSQVQTRDRRLVTGQGQNQQARKKGQEKQIIRSKYEEDVLINNHATVWGSFWSNGRWGYKCCYSFVKLANALVVLSSTADDREIEVRISNSYCTGDAGKSSGESSGVANNAPPASVEAVGRSQISDREDSGSSSESDSSHGEVEGGSSRKRKNRKKKKDKKRRRKENKRKIKVKKMAEEETDQEKLHKFPVAFLIEPEGTSAHQFAKPSKMHTPSDTFTPSITGTGFILNALEQEEENQKEAQRLLSIDERKRPYNSMFEVKKPTDEEIEAYLMMRRRDEDPMAQFMG